MGKGRILGCEDQPLQSLLDVHMQLHERIFSSTNILLTATSLLFSLAVGFFLTKFEVLTILAKIGVGILIFSSSIALIICLIVLRPKLRHKIPESDFYYMDIFSKYNKEQYQKRLIDIFKKDETVIKFYVEELYALGSKVLLPNFKKIKLATEILIVGVISSLILFVLSFVLPNI